MNEPLRIIFAGTPEFSVPSLSALAESVHRLISVYTQPDRQAGRGRKLMAGPVKRRAMELGLPVFQPSNFRSTESVAQLAEQNADLMIVAAYGLILPESVLQAPRLGCINIHASLLPRWRGAAPIQSAILAGDRKTGITIMQMDKGLDTGPMFYKLDTEIGPEDTAGTLHDRLSLLGAKALIEALPGIVDGSLRAVMQEDSLATYAGKIDKSQAAIDWSEPAKMISRKVRAFNPWPVAYASYREAPLRIWEAEVLDETTGEAPGTVMASAKEGIDVATGDGVLRIVRLQLPGKREMNAADFVNAHRLEGVILG